MNRVFYNTLIFVIALFFAGVIVVFSIRPSDEAKVISKKVDTINWTKIGVTNSTNDTVTLKEELIDITTAKLSQDTPILVDFGRLSSFLYLATAGIQSWVLEKTTATGITLGEVSGIISLYDLFLSYTIFDSANQFRLEQITNGSFYIGKEKDGKIAIYAIDGVARLTFLDDEKDMTNMVLFPGSYIRFDPSRNKSLKWADLFRTILSLKDTDNEVFEFVNPRVNIGDEQDTFFNYRLPKKSMILFRILSTRFKEKVEKMDIGRYKAYAYNDTLNDSTWLINPSKRNHNMLLELSSLLSKAVNANSDPDALVAKIWRLYEQAKGLNIADSTAKILVEQFLLDGRFALYAGVANSKYQSTYESIAKIIGIEPTSAKSQLLQNLANIYSKNLFTQKKTNLWLTIDTYAPTATKLVETLDKNEIDQKDNFDIAIYAFNILKKMEERVWELPNYAMEESSSYAYFVTFFRASTRYIASIEDVEKKQETIMSFSRQFYDSMLTMIVNSLYKTFIMTEDGAIFVDSRFRDGLKVVIPAELIDNIKNLSATIEFIAPSIDSLWSPSGASDTYTQQRIQNNMIRLQAFTEIIDPDSYKEYVKTPYRVQTGSSYPFPMIDPEKGEGMRLDTKTVESIKTIKILSGDPRMNELKKIWPDADASSWLIEDNNIRVIKAPYKIARKDGNSRIAISALYAEKTFSDIVVEYANFQISVNTKNGMTKDVLYAFLAKIQYYLDAIDDEVANGRTDFGQMTIYPTTERISIWNSLYTIEIPEE